MKFPFPKEINEAKATLEITSQALENFIKRTNSLSNTPGELMVKSPMAGIVLSSNFRETHLNRTVKPNEPLLIPIYYKSFGLCRQVTGASAVM